MLAAAAFAIEIAVRSLLHNLSLAHIPYTNEEKREKESVHPVKMDYPTAIITPSLCLGTVALNPPIRYLSLIITSKDERKKKKKRAHE